MTRKVIAPREQGELPNEKRCRSCWRLLTRYVDERTGVNNLWCMHCQLFYKDTKEKD